MKNEKGATQTCRIYGSSGVSHMFLSRKVIKTNGTQNQGSAHSSGMTVHIIPFWMTLRGYLLFQKRQIS